MHSCEQAQLYPFPSGASLPFYSYWPLSLAFFLWCCLCCPTLVVLSSHCSYDICRPTQSLFTSESCMQLYTTIMPDKFFLFSGNKKCCKSEIRQIPGIHCTSNNSKFEQCMKGESISLLLSKFRQKWYYCLYLKFNRSQNGIVTIILNSSQKVFSVFKSTSFIWI